MTAGIIVVRKVPLIPVSGHCRLIALITEGKKLCIPGGIYCLAMFMMYFMYYIQMHTIYFNATCVKARNTCGIKENCIHLFLGILSSANFCLITFANFTPLRVLLLCFRIIVIDPCFTPSFSLRNISTLTIV